MTDKADATITITAPNPEYNGVTAGVRFVDGVATITERQKAALEYFGRHRFGISTPVQTGDDKALKIDKADAPLDPLDTAKVEKLTKPEIVALFSADGRDFVPADPDATKAVLAAELAAKITERAASGGDSVNSGPIGPQHNQGHDGADPANTGTPQQPKQPDATI